MRSMSARATLVADSPMLDQITAAATVMPDRAERDLYEVVPPEIGDNSRAYAYQLKHQPGMIRNRHFHMIMVKWVADSTLVKGESLERMSSTAGPNGSYIADGLMTSDGRYVVNVSVMMSSLPDHVRVANVDPRKIAERLAHAYENRIRRK